MPKRKRTSYSGRKPRSAASFAASRRRHLGKKKQFTEKQATLVKKILKESRKYQDCSLNDTTLTTQMTELPMTLPTSGGQFYWIGQGDDQGDRNGDTIQGTTMDIRGTLKSIYFGTTTVRIMLVQWAQNNQHDIREVLNDYQQPAGVNYSNNVVNSFRKVNGTQPYNVLWDKKIQIKSDNIQTGTTGTFPVICKDFRIYVKLTPKQAKMTYGLPAAGGPTKNPIYLYACYADTTGVAANAPKLEYTARVRFVDV